MTGFRITSWDLCQPVGSVERVAELHFRYESVSATARMRRDPANVA